MNDVVQICCPRSNVVSIMNVEELRAKFHASSSGVLDVTIELQDLILSIFPDAVVSEDDDNIGYGFGSGYKNLVFVISPYKGHVNLGIVNGVSPEDPHNLMTGKGKIHRHVKIRRADQLQDPNLKQLMLGALSMRSSDNI